MQSRGKERWNYGKQAPKSSVLKVNVFSDQLISEVEANQLPNEPRTTTYQDDHRVVQGPVGVKRLNVALNVVLPLHTKVDEGPGLGLLPFAIEDVMAGSLVLNS